MVVWGCDACGYAHQAEVSTGQAKEKDLRGPHDTVQAPVHGFMQLPRDRLRADGEAVGCMHTTGGLGAQCSV